MAWIFLLLSNKMAGKYERDTSSDSDLVNERQKKIQLLSFNRRCFKEKNLKETCSTGSISFKRYVTDSATKYIWYYCRAESERFRGLYITTSFFFNYSLLCFIWSSPNLTNLQKTVIAWFFTSNLVVKKMTRFSVAIQ